MKRAVAVGFIACVGLALGRPVLAQRTTGAISGTVQDATNAAVPGVTVSIKGPNIVGDQTATTNEQGFYRMLNLPPGDYEVTFSLGGFKSLTRSGVRVPLGVTIEENATLELGQLQETVAVVADATVVDTSSNEVGSNFGREWVENAPLRRFSFFDIVASAPGALQGGDSDNTINRTMVFGSSYDENSFQVDGVDVTDNFFNEAQAEPNVDAIAEVEILSLGAPAEYGNLTGAVYNIVTRQGTNQFHGDTSFYFQSDGLTSNNTKDIVNPDGSFLDACGDDPSRRCPWTRDRFTDFTAQVGGPILKDRLWFFGSFEHQRDSLFDVSIPTTNDLSAVSDATERYFAKVNWQVTSNHQIVGNFNYDDRDEANGLDLNSAPSTAWTRLVNTPTPGVAYSGVLSNKTVLEVRYSGFYAKSSGSPTDPNQPRDLTRFFDVDTGFISGGHYYWYELTPTRTTATAKLSHLSDSFMGASHDFRFGVQYTSARAGGLYGYNDFIYTYSQTYPGYGFGYDREPFSYSGNTRGLGAFFDDTIRANDRVSFNVGLRYDWNKAFAAEQEELDASGRPTGRSFSQTDFFTWNSISPRVGINLKLTNDGKTVLKGHFGRYHRAVATGEFANVIGPSIKPTFAGGYDLATNAFLSRTLSESNENLGVDPGYDSPYTDQYILSLEREVVKGLGANLSYVHKSGRRFAGWEEIAATYVPVTFVDDQGAGATGRTIQLLAITSDPALRQFRINNQDLLDTSINAISLGLTRPMANRLQFSGSLTWLRATGGLQEGQGGSGEQSSGVGITQRGGLQFRDFGKNPNAYVNLQGRLRTDVEWQGKAQVVAQLPAGFLVSTSISSRSGAHRVRRTRVPVDITGLPDFRVILLQPRGENGRISSLTTVDFRLQKDFNLSQGVRLSILADALNLFNTDTTQTTQSSFVTSDIFEWPAEPVDPRRLMIGVKLRF